MEPMDQERCERAGRRRLFALCISFQTLYGIPSGPGAEVFITLAEIAYISMCEIYVTMGESIYPIPSSLSRVFRRHLGNYSGFRKSSRFKIWLTDWNDDKEILTLLLQMHTHMYA
jgi:hypothetical protein